MSKDLGKKPAASAIREPENLEEEIWRRASEL
jgi:hypothetical protein